VFNKPLINIFPKSSTILLGSQANLHAIDGYFVGFAN